MTEVMPDIPDDQLSFGFDEPITPMKAMAQFAAAYGNHQSKETRIELIREELAEMVEAIAHLFKEMADVIYVCNWAAYGGVTDKDLTEGTQALIALMNRYISMVPTPVMGEIFTRVHNSNMSKLGPDGKPMYNDIGKVMKGPNYKAPYLADLV